jgi:WD40 repeat protein
MAVAFSPGGQVLAEGGSDDQVRLWSTATGAPLAVIPQPQPVTSLAWDGPGTLVAGDADGYVRAWRVPVPELMTGSPANSVAFSPGGSALAVGGADLQVWNPATRDLTASAAIPRPGPNDFVNAVAFSPSGNLIATGYGDGRIQLWRPGAHLVPLGTPRAASRASPAAGGNAVEFVAFGPGGDILASAADDGTVRLWNVANPAKPALVSTLRASADAVFSVAFGAGGRLLAASSADDKVRLWNVANPAAPARLGKALTGPVNTAYSVAFSPRGHLLAVGSADRDVRLWDISDPARPHRVGPVLTGPSGYVYSVAFGPGGRVLAAGNTDGSVWLWNLADPARPGLIATLTGPAGHVFSVGFGPGGRTVAAADSSGLVWLWNIQAGAAARGVCAMAGQPLARAEWQIYVPGLPYAPPCRLFRVMPAGIIARNASRRAGCRSAAPDEGERAVVAGAGARAHGPDQIRGARPESPGDQPVRLAKQPVGAVVDVLPRHFHQPIGVQHERVAGAKRAVLRHQPQVGDHAKDDAPGGGQPPGSAAGVEMRRGRMAGRGHHEVAGG